ncbi:MAG: hypothetical protein ACI4B3_00560 [Prevotella sp.]
MAKKIFSCSGAELNKSLNTTYYNLFKELPTRAAYRNGDITAWRTPNKSYIYCYKNIAIMELTGLSHDFLEAIINGTEFKYPQIVEIARERIERAEEYAKEYGFKLESI